MNAANSDSVELAVCISKDCRNDCVYRAAHTKTKECDAHTRRCPPCKAISAKEAERLQKMHAPKNKKPKAV